MGAGAGRLAARAADLAAARLRVMPGHWRGRSAAAPRRSAAAGSGLTPEARARAQAAKAKAARLVQSAAAIAAAAAGGIREGPTAGLILGLLAFWLFAMLRPPPD